MSAYRHSAGPAPADPEIPRASRQLGRLAACLAAAGCGVCWSLSGDLDLGLATLAVATAWGLGRLVGARLRANRHVTQASVTLPLLVMTLLPLPIAANVVDLQMNQLVPSTLVH